MFAIFDEAFSDNYLSGAINLWSNSIPHLVVLCYFQFQDWAPCRLSKHTVMECLNSSRLVANSREACGCRPQCQVRNFDIQTSMAKWPTEDQWRKKAQKYGLLALQGQDGSSINSEDEGEEEDQVFVFFQIQFNSTTNGTCKRIPLS